MKKNKTMVYSRTYSNKQRHAPVLTPLLYLAKTIYDLTDTRDKWRQKRT